MGAILDLLDTIGPILIRVIPIAIAGTAIYTILNTGFHINQGINQAQSALNQAISIATYAIPVFVFAEILPSIVKSVSSTINELKS